MRSNLVLGTLVSVKVRKGLVSNNLFNKYLSLDGAIK